MNDAEHHPDHVRLEAVRCIRDNDYDGFLKIKDNLAAWGARYIASFANTFGYACGERRVKFVNTFLEIGFPMGQDINYSLSPLRETASKGFDDIFELIYPLYDTYDLSGTDFLLQAIKGGSLVILKAALTRPERDWRLKSGLALGAAIHAGKIDVVRFLLPFVDPKVMDSRALLIASERQSVEIFHLLYPLSDPLAARSAHERDGKVLGGLLAETLKAEQSKNELRRNLDNVSEKPTKHSKKI